jgi:PilZ domain-containing protein
MKQNERSIVRKKTQSLVYLELGRENGAVMLNLSEAGCGFQAISPVKLGKTRFAFQISGGRRIAGEAEVEWVDEAGVTGGLHFLDLQPEARKQVRMWLNDTNAPEEPGEGVTTAAAPVAVDTLRQSWVEAQNWQASAGPAPAKETRRDPRPETSVGVAEEPALAAPWANMPPGGLPVLEDVRARFPLMRGDDSYLGARARSAARWRGLAVLATLVAAGAFLYVYQREAGESLIWLGETLAGRTKASAAIPQTKPAETAAAPAETAQPPVEANGASEKTDAEEAPKTRPDATPTTESELTRGKEQPLVQSEAVIRSTQPRQESMLEQPAPRQKEEPPRSEGESVASLWDAVQGGSIAAEMSLAERFARGEGVAKNCDQARVLLKAAAGKGNKEARLRLYQLESGGCQ